MREKSLTSQLRKAGFADPARGEALLNDTALDELKRTEYLAEFDRVADPDQCLLAFIRLKEACDAAGCGAILRGLVANAHTRARLVALLGMSSSLGDFMISHPLSTEEIVSQPGGHERAAISTTTLARERALALEAVGADPETLFPVAQGKDCINKLRVHYFTRIGALAASDLTAPDPLEAMPEVASQIADIVGGTLDAALAVARAEVEDAEKVGLAIIAMGKTGARELNYISDVDVVYVARGLDGGSGDGEPLDEASVIRITTRLATSVGRAVSASAGEPALWILDANLRPEGKDGPLVRTLESHVAYYDRWAKGWEFQALLKARPVAGDMELGEAYISALRPKVWEAANRENFVEDSRAMRRRVEEHVPAREQGRQLKLGKGGLRDVEFTVQLLQLVHGRTDESLRTQSTLDSIGALRDGGYVARKDAELLDHDYRFLRTLEHRIQLQRLRRSHLVPSGEAELRRVARSLQRAGIHTSADLEKAWQDTRRQVRKLHEAIYYRPLLPEAARLSPDDVSLNSEAAKARLSSMGYLDPSGALNHISALTSGVSRTAAIQRQLLPVMLGWFAQGPEPDAGLLAFRVLSETMGRTSWYMRTLRDGGAAAERLCLILSSSRYLADQIPGLAESISWLVDKSDLFPPTREELDTELESLLTRRHDPSEIVAAGRYLRRRELMRTSMGQVLRVVEPAESRAAVSHAAEIAIEAGLRAAQIAGCQKLGIDGPLSRYAVVALGRLGGKEMGYASDADILFLHDPLPGSDEFLAQRLANEIASQLARLLKEASPEPPMPVDYDLRPEGRNGVLARSLGSLVEYYGRWAEVWEFQSLLRARPIAGDEALSGEFVKIIDPFRYPAGGLGDAALREVRRIKARVETERMPRGVQPQRHLKLGRGGLADIEWTTQLLQLQHAGAYPALRTTATLPALAAARDVGLLSSEDHDRLVEAWSRASLLRDLNFLGTGRAQSSKIDVLPHELGELAVVASLMGKDTSERHDVEEEYLRGARRARAIVERVFYAHPEPG